jgi:cob(I)alamin adenosyltransferase
LACLYYNVKEQTVSSRAVAGKLESPEALHYLNRCSDLRFMLARDAEQARITPTGGAPMR